MADFLLVRRRRTRETAICRKIFDFHTILVGFTTSPFKLALCFSFAPSVSKISTLPRIRMDNKYCIQIGKVRGPFTLTSRLNMPRQSLKESYIARFSFLYRLSALASAVQLTCDANVTSCLPIVLLCMLSGRRLKDGRRRRYLKGSRMTPVPKSTEWRRLVLPMYNEQRRRSYTRLSDKCLEVLVYIMRKR